MVDDSPVTRRPHFIPLYVVRDRFVAWPSLCAGAFMAAYILFLCQAPDLRDKVPPRLWEVGLSIPIMLGLIVMAIMWLGGAIASLFSLEWRRFLTCGLAPAVIIMAMRPIATAHDPLHRLINSRELEIAASRGGLPVGQRFAAFDITQGLFVPPLTLLIYDETDQVGAPTSEPRATILARRSATDQSVRSACTGVSGRVARHYYICAP